MKKILTCVLAGWFASSPIDLHAQGNALTPEQQAAALKQDIIDSL